MESLSLSLVTARKRPISRLFANPQKMEIEKSKKSGSVRTFIIPTTSYLRRNNRDTVRTNINTAPITAMTSDHILVEQARQGDRNAYAALVDRYRDTVYGLAYYQVGDADTAQDVAQEALIRAMLHLRELRTPERFAPWLRQITVNACREWYRERRWLVSASPLEETIAVPDAFSPFAIAEERIHLHQALRCLSPTIRLTIVLHYFHSYSLQEIAAFLEVPVTTVKSRLRDARARLRKELVTMNEETIGTGPTTPEFTEAVLERLFDAVHRNDMAAVRTMVEPDSRIASAKGRFWTEGPFETSALQMAAIHNQPEMALYLLERVEFDPKVEGPGMLQGAAFHGNQEVIQALLKRGVAMDIHAASRLGDAETVRQLLAADPSLANKRGVDGETPLHCAATVTIARLLLAAGADPEIRDTTYDNTAIEYNYFRGQDVIRYLIARGAEVRFPMACALNDAERVRHLLAADPTLLSYRHPGRPNGNALPITIAASAGAIHALAVLLEFGADVNTQDEQRKGATPLHFAALTGNAGMVAFLSDCGANSTLRADGHRSDNLHQATPREWAIVGKQRGYGCWDRRTGTGYHDEVINLLM